MLPMNHWLIAAPPALAAAATGLVAYAAVYPRSQLFGATVCRTNSPRKLAITFDDGPNPAITPKLLDLLDLYKARATFFVIGKHARDCPDLLKETAARGHVIGNHTDARPNHGRASLLQLFHRRGHRSPAEVVPAPLRHAQSLGGSRRPRTKAARRHVDADPRGLARHLLGMARSASGAHRSARRTSSERPRHPREHSLYRRHSLPPRRLPPPAQRRPFTN